ncbi:DUF192 domain-containing protein [Shimia sagamensis]|uniref:DUF192 domain-containing protein n=1 Tax=Shimia sagamensis TaxID=1566352 RepID=UPI0024B776F6|nr:DUF192 domain-containing protein [Shimia sagamensis]
MAGLVISLPAQAEDACLEDSLLIRGDFGQARFSVDVADTETERAQGLMNRSHMPSSAGMLFVYETTRSASFWMRNTLIPLDMLFADEHGVVQHIHSNAIPLDETPIFGGDEVRYVLEINGGLAAAMGISVGSEMRHKNFLQEIANWRC